MSDPSGSPISPSDRSDFNRNTQPIVAGSDSEGDCNSSEVELFLDVDNHNPELVSSLMEMELSDSGDNHDRKGKGVLRTIETPKIAMGNGGSHLS
jgi:hypothetical protein